MNLFKLNRNWNRYFIATGDADLQKRAYNLINLIRLVLSIVFALSSWYIGTENWWNQDNAQFFFHIALSYLTFSIIIFAIYPLRLPNLANSISHLLFPAQIVADIIFITLLMYAAGGVQSGLGLLLIITIVTASLVSNGRLALFYAAIASICLLLEQSYQNFKWDLATASYTQSVMLSLSCFATAWLAFSLAKRMQYSEELASARSVDLENMAQVNELITQEMQDGVLVVDQDLNIRHYNLQAESLLTLSKEPSDGLTLRTLAPEIADVFSKWILNPDTHNNVLISANNRELKLRFMPINELRGVRAVIFIQDWSQLQTMAQQAKLVALGRLTANIAHEIRNPLSAISHANQLLQEEENISTSTTRILQIIADNIQRIDQIIKDVLELNRRDRTHQEKIELRQYLEDFKTQFCAIEKIPVEYIGLNIPEKKSIHINFDSRHLNQILWNLCKNGWEHSLKKSGSLMIQCEEANMALNIHIHDDGNGVSDEDRTRLFEPFFTTKNTGNGLGLYISRELAAANGAKLNYNLKANTGSIFTLQLKKA
ncbi:MAG TPA: ATP-binding protein [Methylotenera sp.]|nr:ATP-binding protein [Methylotenera sp.]